MSDVGINFISELAWNHFRIWITLDLFRGHRDIHVCQFVCTQSFRFVFFSPPFHNTNISLTRFGRAHPKHSCFMLTILPRVQCTFYDSLYWTKISLWDLRNFSKISLPTDLWCSWKGLSESYSVYMGRFITCQQEFFSVVIWEVNS